MKRLLHIITIIAVGAIFLQATPPSEKESVGIQFYEGTWDDALALAKAQDKLIFLDAYASWCGPCKLLKRNVFIKEEVGSYFNERFINVAIDMEKGNGPRLARQYGVTAYPTLIFVNGNGEVVQKAIGYHTPEQLIGLAKRIEPAGS